MPSAGLPPQTQEVKDREGSDPRYIDEFQTSPAIAGRKDDLLAYIFYSKVSDDGQKPTETDLPYLKPAFTDARQVVIHNARDLHKTIDENGFEYITHPLPDADYSKQDSVRQFYYPSMIKMIKEKFGASEVLPFDHRVRNSSFNTDYGNDQAYTGPVIRPHVDFAPIHASNFIKKIRPANYQEYEGRRWQVINFWRPLRTIVRDPFTVADARTVPESDELLHVAYKNTPRETESFLTLAGKHGTHQWFYYPGQEPDEVLAFKIYDSAPRYPDVRIVPHTSFRGLDVIGALPRYSIEIRFFIAYD